MDLHGVISAVVTPFAQDGERLDETLLRDLVERTIAGGVHGLVPAGSTGEFVALSNAERRSLVEIVVDQARGRVPVVPHVSALSTREAIELARHAEASGAEGIMAVAPWYEPLTMDEVKNFYRDLAAATPLPIVLYNLPVATGVNVTPADVVELAQELPTIEYVKDTTGDFSQAAMLIHDFGDQIKTLVGQDTLFMASLVEGATGSINGAANFIAPQLVQIYDAVTSDDIAGARQVWQEVFPLMQFLVSGGYVSGVKAALDILGHSAGRPRRPINPLPPDRQQELTKILERLAPQLS